MDGTQILFLRKARSGFSFRDAIKSGAQLVYNGSYTIFQIAAQLIGCLQHRFLPLVDVGRLSGA